MVEEETEEQTEEQEEKVAAKTEKTKPAEVTPPNDLITQANSAAMRQESANKELKELLDRQEALAVEQKLGGTAEAGKPQEKKELSDAEYTKKVLANDIETKAA